VRISHFHKEYSSSRCLIIFLSFPILLFLAAVVCFNSAGSDRIRVSTIAGAGGNGAVANGVGSAATFSGLRGVAVDANGLAFIGDMGNNLVRQIDLATGTVSTLAGSGSQASTDGTGTAAAFAEPAYVALDGLGNLYVTDTASHRIRKVVLATRAVTTLAGTGSEGAANGVGTAASFRSPLGIACDTSGNAYVADDDNNRIRKIVLSSATVTTLAGSSSSGAGNGVGTNAGFSSPVNVVVDSSGTLLFVADNGNRRIRQIVIATQTVTTLAGSGTAGSTNGVGTAAEFTNLRALAVDSNGNLFVGDSASNLIRRIVIATKTVTTLAGSGANSWADGFGTNAAFKNPFGLAVDARGNLLVADAGNNRVRLLQPTVVCPAGVYCAPGAASVPCTPGYFCAAGADRALCSQGFYCPAGSTSATQVACPAACPAGSSAPAPTACAVGYDLLFCGAYLVQS
jgi:sugar lactone lactonase YvrE